VDNREVVKGAGGAIAEVLVKVRGDVSGMVAVRQVRPHGPPPAPPLTLL
jgi:hypothetical protein